MIHAKRIWSIWKALLSAFAWAFTRPSFAGSPNGSPPWPSTARSTPSPSRSWPWNGPLTGRRWNPSPSTAPGTPTTSPAEPPTDNGSTPKFGDRVATGVKRVFSSILKENVRVPLFIGQTMAESMRDVGYLKTTTAICEHVDNALAAGATEIRIYFRERREQRGRAVVVAGPSRKDRHLGLRQRPWDGSPGATGRVGFRRVDGVRQSHFARPVWHRHEGRCSEPELGARHLLVAGAEYRLQRLPGPPGDRAAEHQCRVRPRTRVQSRPAL